MNFKRWTATLVTALCLSTTTQAASLTLPDLTSADYDKIVKELAANFSYSSVNGASSLGSVWGLEFGAVGGYTKTPEIYNLVKRADPNSSFKDKFPHAAGLLRVSVPLGLTFEGLIFPKITVSDVSLKQYGGAAMWTFTDIFFPEWPVTVAAKGFFNKTAVDYSQNINNASTGNIPVKGTISFDNTIYGAQVIASRKFSILSLLALEPYVALGYLKDKGDLTVTASVPNVSLFADQRQSATSKPSSSQLIAGLDFKLLFIALGAEFQRSFGRNSYTGRLSFRF